MACYLMLARLTERGRPLVVDDLAGRACASSLAQVREVAADLGVTVQHAYVVMGDDDFLIVAQAEDDSAMTKFAMAIGGQGKVRTKTMRAFDEKEADELFQSRTAAKALKAFVRQGG